MLNKTKLTYDWRCDIVLRGCNLWVTCVTFGVGDMFCLEEIPWGLCLETHVVCVYDGVVIHAWVFPMLLPQEWSSSLSFRRKVFYIFKSSLKSHKRWYISLGTRIKCLGWRCYSMLTSSNIEPLKRALLLGGRIVKEICPAVGKNALLWRLREAQRACPSPRASSR